LLPAARNQAAKMLDLMARTLPNHYDVLLGLGARLMDRFGKR